MKSNMYEDAIYRWNVFKGCEYNCKYCIPSFQRQSKRQKNRCMDCYNYIPHFHEERLYQRLPKTIGDQFIWVGSSGDISFCKEEWMTKILNRIKEMPDRTFFFQTKNPLFYWDYFNVTEMNIWLGITYETNRMENYNPTISDDSKPFISKAPDPNMRCATFHALPYPKKIITIEPILDFDLDLILFNIFLMKPKRIYIGYDSKNCKLPEPPLSKTLDLIRELEKFTVVKRKLIRKAWYE